MKHVVRIGAAMAMALSFGAIGADLNPLIGERWKTRPVIVVVPTRGDALLRKVEAALQTAATREAFIDREMVLYTVAGGEGHRNGVRLPTAQTRALLDALELTTSSPPTFLLVGKDGGIKMTKTADVDLGAVFAEIDRMPMRRR